MRLVSLVMVAALAARPALGQTVTQRPVALPGFTAWVRLDTVGQAVRVAAPPAAVFAALRAVYAELRVATTLDDSAGGILGTLRPLHLSTLAGSSLSRSLECGAGISGLYADNARVDLVIATMIAPAPGDSTAIRTALVASAQTMDGPARPRLLCLSKGFIESWVRTHVLARVAGP